MRYFTNSSQRIQCPENFGLGTKTAPILSETDQKRLQGVPSIEENYDGQEEGPSTSRRAAHQTLLGDAEDQPVRDARTDDELSMLIEKVEMTTTEVMTETAQQTVEAHIRGGGPTNENPM